MRVRIFAVDQTTGEQTLDGEHELDELPEQEVIDSIKDQLFCEAKAIIGGGAAQLYYIYPVIEEGLRDYERWQG